MSYIGKKTKSRSEIPMKMVTKIRASRKSYNRKKYNLTKEVREKYGNVL